MMAYLSADLLTIYKGKFHVKARKVETLWAKFSSIQVHVV